ncbi:hypothetical protein [Sphingomonas sanguinis]|jgi:hypothetical protein|uniref:Uncharacterized protein n=1 Tax=Sphingomonas sanguinis TaxID=33051 RepID=A0A7Y7QV04_9SPHN|nr:hypothetical protein [Sphingomonas sanguinis]MBZ6381864.1 hypothetical protein [Sphingomonas sanguinis]NNG49301.1 hypothetical protein [Sphingomonas sanguinis]NNG54091.1 hypothetical protein [Sphingomonas sanguinis]NVP31164.1 hypothetical protein [Sphingomonas sanguinis]
MAKGDRLARLDALREDMERDYREALIAALRTTAAGKWGLFDHRKDRAARAAAAPVVAQLTEMGEEIDAARAQLGLSAFALHAEFLAARGPVGPEAVGEPKQAQAWLDRLAAEG